MITFKAFLAELYKPNIRQVLDAISGNSVYERNKSTHSQLSSLAKQYKFNEIGDGFFAVVYKHEQYPFVVKVWKPDEGFDKWLDFVLKNQNNPYVPKVKGKPVQVTGTKFKAIRLEYLQHLSKRLSRADIATFLTRDDKNIMSIKNYLYSPSNTRTKIVYNDLHSDNIMQRSNGEWVITDPLAG